MPANQKRSKAPRYLWMVTQDGSFEGYYGNCAASTLFLTYEEAFGFVKECIRDCVMKDMLVDVTDPDEEDIKEAIAEHVEWFGTCAAQYRDGGSVTDWEIQRVPMPNKKVNKSNKKKGSKK